MIQLQSTIPITCDKNSNQDGCQLQIQIKKTSNDLGLDRCDVTIKESDWNETTKLAFSTETVIEVSLPATLGSGSRVRSIEFNNVNGPGNVWNGYRPPTVNVRWHFHDFYYIFFYFNF